MPVHSATPAAVRACSAPCLEKERSEEKERKERNEGKERKEMKERKETMETKEVRSTHISTTAYPLRYMCT